MSSPVSSGQMGSGTVIPQNSGTGIQWVTQPIPTAPLPIAGVNPRLEGANINFRPLVPSNQGNMVIHHVHHYAPTPTPHFLGNYGANYNPNFPGFGATNVSNWLQGNYQASFANFSTMRFPPPSRPAAPFANPGNANTNALHGFNNLAHQQNLFGYGPTFRPRQAPQLPVTNPVNIYRPRVQSPTTRTLGIGASAGASSVPVPTPIPENSTQENPSTDQSSPQETSILVPKEEPDQDPPAQDQRWRIREKAEEIHKCHTCNKFFESGKALGGHMSSHEKKRKRDKELTGMSSMTSASTADQASTSRTRADLTLTEGSGELDPSDEDEQTPKLIESKKRD